MGDFLALEVIVEWVFGSKGVGSALSGKQRHSFLPGLPVYSWDLLLSWGGVCLLEVGELVQVVTRYFLSRIRHDI